MPNATYNSIEESRRLDDISEASQEIQFWKRQERVRGTQQGRDHARERRETWTRRLNELQTRQLS
ncbi:MAG: hypothetical protein WCP45_13720 [Verrucomicrobiota bacterium]